MLYYYMFSVLILRNFNRHVKMVAMGIYISRKGRMYELFLLLETKIGELNFELGLNNYAHYL